MNCKQGDLAMIVKSLAGNEGKIVKCLRFVGETGDARDFDSDFWEIDTTINCNERFRDGRVEKTFTNVCPDSQLRPIRGDLLDDEITTSKELEAA